MSATEIIQFRIPRVHGTFNSHVQEYVGCAFPGEMKRETIPSSLLPFLRCALSTTLLPCVLELDECERRTAPVLQIDESHLAELVKQILDVFGADIRRQIAHIDAALVAAAVRHVCWPRKPAGWLLGVVTQVAGRGERGTRSKSFACSLEGATELGRCARDRLQVCVVVCVCVFVFAEARGM